jgi:hypothetical protein
MEQMLREGTKGCRLSKTNSERGVGKMRLSTSNNKQGEEEGETKNLPGDAGHTGLAGRWLPTVTCCACQQPGYETRGGRKQNPGKHHSDRLHSLRTGDQLESAGGAA